MSFFEVRIELSAQDADPFADALLEVGALSVGVEDAAAGTVREKPIFGEPGAVPGLWQACQISAMFGAGANVDQLVAQAALTCGLAVPAYATTIIEDMDWVQANQEQFKPISVSERLWIVPSWHADTVLPEQSVRLLIDPGAAFGTGSHPTTRLCLRWLESQLSSGPASVLDYGCGSGILAIAAMRLGASAAQGVDIDEQALDTARRNAGQNGVEVTFLSAHDRAGSADLVVANILSHPLIMLAPLLAQHTNARGKLALSGILKDQAEEVITAYTDWFDIGVHAQDEDWVCLSGVRRAP